MWTIVNDRAIVRDVISLNSIYNFHIQGNWNKYNKAMKEYFNFFKALNFKQQRQAGQFLNAVLPGFVPGQRQMGEGFVEAVHLAPCGLVEHGQALGHGGAVFKHVAQVGDGAVR